MASDNNGADYRSDKRVQERLLDAAEGFFCERGFARYECSGYCRRSQVQSRISQLLLRRKREIVHRCLASSSPCPARQPDCEHRKGNVSKSGQTLLGRVAEVLCRGIYRLISG